MLTDGKSRNSEFVWSNKGDRIAYASTLRDGADLDFYVIDPTAKPSPLKPLTENQGGGWQVRDWSPDDRTLLVVDGDFHQREPHLAGRCCQRRRRKCSHPQVARKSLTTPSASAVTARASIVATDKDNEYQRVAYMDIATGTLKYLNNDSWDVEDGCIVQRP